MSQFCSETGKPNQKVESTVEELDYPWTEFGDYDTITPEEEELLDGTEFMVPAYHDYAEGSTFILNSSKSKYYITDEEYQVNVDISQIDVKQLVEDFKVEFKGYLDLFEREYGVVNVHFGLVAYAG